MTLLASKQHTVGDTRRWQVDYSKWLDNTATIATVTVKSSSTTCTISKSSIVGNDVLFFLTGGVLSETLIVTIALTDSFGNVKTDTISFHVVAP